MQSGATCRFSAGKANSASVPTTSTVSVPVARPRRKADRSSSGSLPGIAAARRAMENWIPSIPTKVNM